MLQRREFLAGTAGFATLGGLSVAAPDPIQTALKQAVGTRQDSAGMIAVLISETGMRTTSWGSSGVPGLALDGAAVFEIMSNTKVLTSLLLADMVRRGEVAFNDPVSKYLPVTLHEHDGPITLLDLATYTSGLPNMPGNLPANWYALPDPLGDYTEAKLFDFLSAYVPSHAPGTHYAYANLGFGLLGIALARRAGMSYEDLLVERVCKPLGMAHTRIELSADMRQHAVQGHDVDMKPTRFWNWPAMPGAGYVRSTARDLTVFVKANMGLLHSPLQSAMALMLETRRPTSLPGTEAGLGWFITTDDGEQIVWKSGLSGGCNTFMGFSPQRRCGAVLLSNFLWQPLDAGTISMGVKMIKPDFHPVDFNAVYPHV